MKTKNIIGNRTKETPVDAQTANHIFMIRGGYVRNVASGIFSMYAPMTRVVRKIEAILREEMDAIGGQEVIFPVVMPKTLWDESGRYDAVGQELLRFEDRSGSMNVLGMTHEEAAVHLARDTASSYQDYPFMIYQIQTKFRDEARSRGGLMRVREFTMKDAYSYHTNQEDMDSYYNECLEAYTRIFKRAGLKDVAVVKADSGMMGGSVSHEFMYLSPIGEDKLAVCPCGFASNLEVAEHICEPSLFNEEAQEKIHTPNAKTIEDLTKLLNLPASQFMKAVVYKLESDGSAVVAFIRGDLEISETKLRNHLGTNVEVLDKPKGLETGFIGAVGLEGFKVVFDRSLQGGTGFVGGANEIDYHIKGINMPRDFAQASFVDIATAVDGGICPKCKKPALTLSNGVEVGNIFQLGDKYSATMNMQYQDQEGKKHAPIMGCYGIGVGRLAASVLESSHDNYGPIWPISIAPWQVQLCALNTKKNPEIRDKADEIYKALQAAGIEVLYDDREVSPGHMFADADLFGLPLRVVVSPKSADRGCVEFSYRNKTHKADIDLNVQTVVAEIQKHIEELKSLL